VIDCSTADRCQRNHGHSLARIATHLLPVSGSPAGPDAVTTSDATFTLLREDQWGWGKRYVEYQALETEAQAPPRD
jgi:hypothetical protein